MLPIRLLAATNGAEVKRDTFELFRRDTRNLDNVTSDDCTSTHVLSQEIDAT
jgi:hypothetical protein